MLLPPLRPKRLGRCLHELASIPQSKLLMLTHGFALSDLKAVIGKVDASKAECQGKDREGIEAHIVRHYGTLERFNTELRLRLLLQPTSYQDDIEVRGAAHTFCTRVWSREVSAPSKE